jgi:hypothetical protein
MSSGNVFSKFYDSLREIRDYHKRHPVALRDRTDEDVDKIVDFRERLGIFITFFSTQTKFIHHHSPVYVYDHFIGGFI